MLKTEDYLVKLANDKELKIGSVSWHIDDPSGMIYLDIPMTLKIDNYYTELISLDNCDYAEYIVLLEVINNDTSDSEGYYFLDTRTKGRYLKRVKGKEEYLKRFNECNNY